MAIGLSAEQPVNKFVERWLYWHDKLKGQVEAIEAGESPALANAVESVSGVGLPVELVKMTPYIKAFADTIEANNLALAKHIPHGKT